jgi:hypothetical protein
MSSTIKGRNSISIKPHMFQEVMKMVHYAYFHSTTSYEIIFCGNSTGNTKIFKMQKRANRIVTGRKKRVLDEAISHIVS